MLLHVPNVTDAVNFPAPPTHNTASLQNFCSIHHFQVVSPRWANRRTKTIRAVWRTAMFERIMICSIIWLDCPYFLSSCCRCWLSLRFPCKMVQTSHKCLSYSCSILIESSNCWWSCGDTATDNCQNFKYYLVKSSDLGHSWAYYSF